MNICREVHWSQTCTSIEVKCHDIIHFIGKSMQKVKYWSIIYDNINVGHTILHFSQAIENEALNTYAFIWYSKWSMFHFLGHFLNARQYFNAIVKFFIQPFWNDYKCCCMMISYLGDLVLPSIRREWPHKAILCTKDLLGLKEPQ